MERREGIHVWRYVLRSRMVLNARSRRRRFEGALIRVGDGFGCVHPWPELGDPPLESLLGVLARGGAPSPLLVRALGMAATDARARAMGVSLFARLEVPASHATVPVATGEAIGEAVGRGYGIVKLKGGRDLPGLATALNGWSRSWPDLRWRIDFNGVPGVVEVIRFWECLTEQAAGRIDFLEDPCRYDPGDWEALKGVSGLELAMDRGADPAHRVPDLFVVKPARELGIRFGKARRRLVVTSNMDHPVGQCYAAVEAGRLWRRLPSRVVSGGLQTHELFEADAFIERLGPAGPGFVPPGGTGLGFDDLLEDLPWKRLS